MLKNVSYRNWEIEKEMEELVGKSFPLFQRLKMRGNGSPRLLILEASQKIKTLLEKDTNLNYCNIELRPHGIVLGFRSRLESWSWCVPYYKLSIFQNKNSYTIFSDTERVVIQKKTKSITGFFRKLTENKAKYYQSEQFVLQ